VIGLLLVGFTLVLFLRNGCVFPHFRLLDSLAKRQRAAEHIQVLLKTIQDANSPEAAVDAAVAELAEKARSTYRFERDYALGSIGRIGRRAAPAMSAVIEGLRSDDGFDRDAAAHACARLGVVASSARPDLIRVVKEHTSESAARYAIEALEGIGDNSPEVLQVLQFAIEARDSEGREGAIRALRKLTAGDPAPLGDTTKQ
jgi:HEAT repeat protein